MNKTTGNGHETAYTTVPIEEVKEEDVEMAMPKDEFIKILFTDKRFRLIPNKKAIAQIIRKMNEEEYKELLHQAFGELKYKKKK